MSKSIFFFNDDVSYQLRDKNKIRNWIHNVVREEKKSIDSLNIVLCSDIQLLKINKDHLNHDYFTDIITFDYSQEKLINGEIYISLDRVKDNAKKLNLSTRNELHRVIIHGVLHLCGYSDKSEMGKVFNEVYGR